MKRVQSGADGLDGSYAVRREVFSAGIGTSSALYLYERRYAAEPFTASIHWRESVGPSARTLRTVVEAACFALAGNNVRERRHLGRRHEDRWATRSNIIRYGKTWACMWA